MIKHSVFSVMAGLIVEILFMLFSVYYAALWAESKMPTRISTGVGDHPCFFTFITIIPIASKITIFSLH